MPDLVGELVGLGLVIGVGRSDEHAQTGSDRTGHVESNRPGATTSTLARITRCTRRTHVRSLPRAVRSGTMGSWSIRTTQAPLRIGDRSTQVDIDAVDPAAGSPRSRSSGVELLIGRRSARPFGDPMRWGCYPMVPWAGRVRDGRFELDGRVVPAAGECGRSRPARCRILVRRGGSSPHTGTSVELSLDLPRRPTPGRSAATLISGSTVATTDGDPARAGGHRRRPAVPRRDRLASVVPQAGHAGVSTRPRCTAASTGIAVDERIDVPARSVGRLLRERRTGRRHDRRRHRTADVGLHRVGRLRRAGARHLHRAAIRPAGRLQHPATRARAGSDADAVRSGSSSPADGIGPAPSTGPTTAPQRCYSTVIGRR